jgi:hypothetical protein
MSMAFPEWSVGRTHHRRDGGGKLGEGRCDAEPAPGIEAKPVVAAPRILQEGMCAARASV